MAEKKDASGKVTRHWKHSSLSASDLKIVIRDTDLSQFYQPGPQLAAKKLVRLFLYNLNITVVGNFRPLHRLSSCASWGRLVPSSRSIPLYGSAIRSRF